MSQFLHNDDDNDNDANKDNDGTKAIAEPRVFSEKSRAKKEPMAWEEYYARFQ